MCSRIVGYFTPTSMRRAFQLASLGSLSKRTNVFLQRRAWLTWACLTFASVIPSCSFTFARVILHFLCFLLKLFWFTFIISWSTLGSYLLTEIFHMFKASYLFYFYLALPPLAMLMLIIFVIVAKRYKLRERERHVNIQAIVEEHYERYFDQEEYMREDEIDYSINSD